MSVADEIRSLYAARGSAVYFGERVTMTEHALQAAWFGQCERAPESLVVAALLHDVGHLVEPAPEDLADWTTDARHEEVGARWLAQHFAASVAEPVRLHVPAKRYLCATDADYLRRLSEASVHTLKLQGGPMSAAEVAQFESEPHFREAVRLRMWDDQGKVVGLRTPPLSEYLTLVEKLARPRAT